MKILCRLLAAYCVPTPPILPRPKQKSEGLCFELLYRGPESLGNVNQIMYVHLV